MVAIVSTTVAPQLSRLITEKPTETAQTQARKAALYSLVAKVCLVAFVAIAAGAIALSLGLIAPIHPALFLTLLLSTLPLQVGFQMGLMRSIDCQKKADRAKLLAAELKKIEHWKKPEIETFFKEHKISLDKLSLPLLAKIDRNEPMRALLPAIAFYNYQRDMTQILYKKHLDNLYFFSEDPESRLLARRIGWNTLEREVLPSALNAALALQVISQPTFCSELSIIGSFRIKEFDERIFDQTLQNDDNYFVFNNQEIPSLTLKELREAITTLDFDEFRRKIFIKSRH